MKNYMINAEKVREFLRFLQHSFSRSYARPRAHTLGYKKAFSLGGLRFIGFVIQCLCYSGFVIPFQ